MRTAAFIVCIIFGLSTYAFAEPVKLVIFIHGTLGLKHHLSVNTFLKLLHDSIENSFYKKSVTVVRNDPFFYQNQTMQQMGFHPIEQTPQKHQPIASLFAHIYEQFEAHPAQKTIYYTFGWSGLASHKERLKAARHFYAGLTPLIEQLEKEHGVTPAVEVVGYSHGATIALLSEEVRQELAEDPPFFIDTLMLLGTPVQKETERYICSPLFKKIFHFYSRADNIQCLDCFSTKRFFSRRRFGHHSYCTLPESLHQIEIKITQMCNKPMHQRRVNLSPGHMELWFFGWPTTMYRKHFPLYPIPTAALLPYIARVAEQYSDKNKHMVIELQPDTGRAVIRQRFAYATKKIPFISPKKIRTLQKKVLQYKPDYFSEELYNAHVQTAIGHVHHKPGQRQHKRFSTFCGC